MKKLVLICGFLLSLYSYGDDISVVEHIQQVNPRVTKEQATHIVEVEKHFAKVYDIPVEIGLSLTAQESSFNAHVKSSGGESYGLKMIRLKTWKKQFKTLSKSCLNDVECNIDYGYKILRIYMDQNHGNIRSALMNYRGSKSKIVNAKYADNIIRNSQMIKNKMG